MGRFLFIFVFWFVEVVNLVINWLILIRAEDF